MKNEYRSCRRRLSVETMFRNRSSLHHESIYKIASNKCKKNIKILLKDKSFETINDSTILRMLKIVNELLFLLFIKDSDIKQKLMNINRKLKQIDNNTFKTKTNIDTYAIAVKIRRFEKAEKTQNARRKLVAKTKQQKFFTKFKRRKTLMMKINNEKKNVYTTFIYQEFHAKIDHNEEKEEKYVFNATIIQRKFEIVCKFRKNQNTNETRFDVDE
jgi:hypothetical protein